MSMHRRFVGSGWRHAGCGAAVCCGLVLASPLRGAEPPPAPTADVAPAAGVDLKHFPGEAHLLAAMDRVEGALKSTETSIQQIEAREALVESSYAHALVQSPAAKAELLKAQRQLALFRQTPDRAALRRAGEYLSLAMRLAPEGEEPAPASGAVAPASTSPSTAISSPQTTLVPRTLRTTPSPTPSQWPPAPSAPTAVAPPPSSAPPALAATTATTYDWNSTAPQAPQTPPPTRTEVHHHYAPAPPPVVREEIHVYPGYGYGYHPYHYHRPHYHYHPRPVYVAPPSVSVGGSNWRFRVNF